MTPEVAVYTSTGRVYRGRIDDLYVNIGEARREPTRRDLRDALDASIAGRAVAQAETIAVGCFIERKHRCRSGTDSRRMRWRSRASRSRDGRRRTHGSLVRRCGPRHPTFATDIAPIIYANCTVCHRLASRRRLRCSPKDVRKRGQTIVNVTARRVYAAVARRTRGWVPRSFAMSVG